MAKKKKDYLTEEEYNARRLRSAAATGKDGSTYTTGGKATTSYEDYKNYVNSQENEEYWEEHSGTYEPGYGSDPAKAARKNETDARLSTRSRLHSNNPRSKYSGDSDFTHSVRAKKAQEAQEKLEKKRESKDTKFGIKFNDRTDEGFRNSKGQTFGEWLTEIKETGNTPEGLEPLRSDEEVYSIQVNRLVNDASNWLEQDFTDRHNVESNYARYSREIQRQLDQSQKFINKYKNDDKLRAAFEDTSKVLMSLQNSLNYAANTREATLEDMTVGSIKQGYYQKRLGEELNKQMMGEENEVEKYAKLLASDEFNFDTKSKLKSAVPGAGNLVGQIGGTIVDPNTWALMATNAAVGAGLGTTVLPGLGTVGGLFAGLGAGFVQSSVLNAYEMESGFAYQELLDNGIAPELAKKIAIGVGGVNAALEMVQADTLVDAFKVVKKAGAETVAGKIAQELSRRGLDVGKETAQEVAQEATTIIGAQAASKIQNDKWQYTSDEVKDRLKETAISSALGFGVLNAPAAAVNTGRTISRSNQNLDLVGAIVKSQDAAEMVNRTEERIRQEEPQMGDIDRAVTSMAVAKKINGETLTAAEEYHISKSPVAQRILEESAAGTLQAGNNVTKLIDDASKSKDEKTVKLAKNLRSKLETGQRLSDREVGKLYTYVNKTAEKRETTKPRAAKEHKSDTPIETKTNIERQAESKVDTSEARTQVIIPDSLGSNKTATLKSISIEDDGTYVELDNGEKVLADDVNLNKGVKQIIDDFAHYDTELANQAVMSYVEAPQETKEVQSPTTFSRQFSLAVEYSRLGRPMEFAVRSGTVNTLSETQLQTAYSIGQRLSSVSAKQKFIDDSRVLGQRRQGSFSMEKVNLNRVKRTLSKQGYDNLKKEIRLITALTQTTGINIELEESSANNNGVFTGANGWMDKNGTIHLDVNALRDTTSDENSMMLYTLSHELTHLAKVYSPQMWKEYSDFMIRVMEENGENIESLIQAKKEEYASMGQTLTNDQALEEIVAQGSQMCLTNSGLLERMAWENMTMFQKFKEWLLGIIEDIKRTYRTYDKNLGRETDAIIDRLDEVAARFEELQIDAIRAMNETPVELDSKMLREVKDQNGEALFQMRTMSQDLDNYMGDIKKAGIMTDEEISQLRTDILEIMKLIASNMEVLDYNHDMDKSNRPFSPVKLNGDPHYKAALDFSTLCRKRLLQQTVIEALQTKLERAASAEEQVAIREELSKMRDRYDKIQVACALCYVEAARLATPNATNEFFGIRITREDGTVEFVESLEDLDPKDEKNKSKIVETINVREKAIVEHFALKSKWFKDEKKKISKEMFGEEKISKDEIKEKVFDILMGKSNDKLTDNAEAYPVTANVVADFEKKAAEIREKKRKKPEEIEKSLEREARRFANLVRDEYYDTTVARRMGYKEHMTDKEKEIAAELETIPKEEFLSANGLAKMSLKNPEIYDAFISYVRNRARSKALEGRVPYVRGDLVNTKKAGGSRVASNALLVAMNLESGFRHQSWSDFEAMHILDLIGAIIDFSTINIGTKKKPEYGIKAHAYTKVADMVRVCGYTGMMLNMSLIPSKTGFKEGVDLSDPSKLTVADLDFDSVEGMAYEVMMELRDLFPETAGNIAIGMNERQIELLMESDEIDYIIPYHRSGLPKELAGRMSLGEWDDFQDYQNPTEKREEGSSEKPKEAKGPALKDWFDIEEGKKAEDGRAFMREASKKYIELCNKKNIVPPFPQLLNKRDDGTYELKNENSNYWKVLIDRKMVNHKTNKVIEQKKVQPKFDTSAIMAVLMREVSSDVREQNDQASNEIIQKILKGELHISDQMTKDVQELAESGRLEEKLNADAKAIINNPLINAIAHKDFVKMSPETGDIEVYARPDEFDEQALGKFINKQKKKTGINLTVYDYQGEEVFNVSWEKGATWKAAKKVLTDYYNKGIVPGEATPVFDEDEEAKYQLRNYEIAERDEFAEAMETYAKTPVEKRVLNEYRRRLNEYIRRRLYRDSVYDQLSATKQESEKKRLNKSLLDAEKEIREMDAALFRMESNSQPVKDLLAKQTKEIVKGVKVVERAVREQKVQDEIDKRRAQMARFRENVHDKEDKTKLRTHIKKKVKRLDDMLRHATNTRHIPDSLHDAVIQFCEVFTDNTSIFTKTQLDDIRAAYEMMKEGGRLDDIQLAGQYDENIPEMLNDLRETMVGKRLSELTVSELETVKNIIDHLNHIVNNENTIFFEGKRQQVSDLAKEAILEAQKDGPKKYLFKSGLSKFVGIQNLTPVTFFDNVGPVFKGLFNEMMAAQNDWGRQMEETSKYFEKIAKKYHYYDWSEHTKKRDKRKHYDMTTERGDKISLTVEEAMGLYATWKREQLDETQKASHLSNGGFVKQDAVKEKRLRGIVTYQVDTKDAHPLTQNDMTHIANKILTDDQKAYADELVRYMSNEMAALGNEASQMMHGYSKFKVKYYYPYKSSDMYLKTKLDSPESTPMIKSVGFSKNLTPNANNPVVARDFTDVFTEHVTQMIYYRYMAPAQDNFMRVYNYQTPPEAGSKRVAVKAEISTGYGQNANDYILQFMRDIYGGTKMDLTAATMDKAISLFKQNAVMMSASVVIQQPTSLLRAFAMINPKYFAGVGFSKKAYDEMYKHSGIAVIKSMGRFDIYTSRSTSSWLTKRKYDGFEKAKGAMSDADYRNDLMARAPQKADEMAWTMLWNAVKKETLAKTDLKKDSDEFFAHVTKRFNDIVNHTQVYDSVFVRSQNMRSKDPLMKMMTAFMSEPTLYLNMAYNGLKQGHAFKVAGVLVVAIIINDLAKSLVYAGRDSGDDDDDKTYIEKYIAEVVGNFKEDINPVTYIPFLKDIWSVWEGYDIERSDMSIVTDIRDRLKTAIDSDASLEDRISALAESIGIITGVPVKNVKRDIDTTINIIFDMPVIDNTTPDGVKLAILEELQKDKVIGRFFTFTGDQAYTNMNEALLDGDMDAYNKMREKAKWYIQAQHEDEDYDKADSDIDSGMKNSLKAMYDEGKVTENQVGGILNKLGYDKNDVFFQLEEWKYTKETGESYSKYGELRRAVESGGSIDSAKKKLTDHGVEEKSVDQEVKKHIGTLYKDGKLNKEQTTSRLKQYTDMKDSEIYWQMKRYDYIIKNGSDDGYSNYTAFDEAVANKDMNAFYEARQEMIDHKWVEQDTNSWIKKSTYTAIKMAYQGGKISYSDAVSMLQGLHGDSYYNANRIVNGW